MKTEADFPDDAYGKYVYADWLEETLGLHQLGNPIYRGYDHCVVEKLDGDSVTVSIKFRARNRRCSTSGKVNISDVTSILE